MEMKIKDGLLIRDIAGEHVVIDASEGVDFSKMAMASDTAVSVIKAMQQGVCTAEELAKGVCTAEELAKRLADEYEVTEEEALADVKELIEEMERQGILKVKK